MLMRENQLPVHDTSAEETGRVRPAVDFGDGGVHITRQRVTDFEASTAGHYLADDLSNSVQITVAHFSDAGSASAASAVAVAPRGVLGPRKQLGTWLLASAVIAVTIVYSICNPKWVRSFVAESAKLSKQLSGDIKKGASTPLGRTDVAHATEAGGGTVAGAEGTHGADSGRNSARAVRSNGETASHIATGNARDSGSGGATVPALSPQSKTVTNNPEMPKAAEAKASKSKDGFMVPPPPATPCILPPSLGSFPMQAAQQEATPQHQVQQAQGQASPTPQQPTAASGTTEAAQSAELDDAEKELQAALNSSRRTVGEWTR